MELVDKAIESAKQNILEIEHRTDLTEDEKVTRTIKVFAAVCAGMACQPLPFADILILTPIQAYMGTRIATIRGVPVSSSSAVDLTKEIGGVVGLGFAGQQFVIGLYKTFIPYLGALTTIPLVFGVTYGMGRVMDAYFVAKSTGRKLTSAEIREIWQRARKEGEHEGQRQKRDIAKQHRQDR